MSGLSGLFNRTTQKPMKKTTTPSLLIGILMLMTMEASAQVGISNENSPVDPSAALDVKFSDKGVLIPRMTMEQRDAIANPAEGLMVYCTNCSSDQKGMLTIFQEGNWTIINHHCYKPNPPAAGIHITDSAQITWNWNSAPITLGYMWNTSDNLATATYMGNSLTKTEIVLDCDSTYTRYVWAFNGCGYSAPGKLTQSTHAPDPPSEGIHVPDSNQISWKWNIVPGALGYKWNTTNDYATATDMGTNLAKTETGLSCHTTYFRYVWSYNCGPSIPDTLIQTTWGCPHCGNSITINHVAGAVAPVDKTVTYGIVENPPHLAYATCWITSNLGADHQATSPVDATEPSAGWFWQFNRKQGYKHDGTTRTPNTTWINPINENFNWVSANDPCTLELGAGWRLPTSTEWTSVSSGWSDWTVSWNSVLKLHAAGLLYYTNGSPFGFGGVGSYWCSDQSNEAKGRQLWSTQWELYMTHERKAVAMPVRCLKDY